jgi:glutamine synthetase
MEVKCFDLLANPYLVLAGLLATGVAGIEEQAELPEPVDVDPAALPEGELEERGIRRLPTSLGEAVDAFAGDTSLGAAFGQSLVDAIVAVRRSEIELFAEASDEDVAAALRWVH